MEELQRVVADRRKEIRHSVRAVVVVLDLEALRDKVGTPAPRAVGAQVNFRTAFYNHKGMLIADTRAIAEHYLTGWFAIDFLSCLPVGYINYFSDDPATGAALPSFTHCFFHA